MRRYWTLNRPDTLGIIDVGQDKRLCHFGPTQQVAMIRSADTGGRARRDIAVPLRITTGAGVYLRNTPNRTAAKPLLHFGAIVTLLGEDTQGGETWNRVSTADGEGWIPATYLSDYTPDQALPIGLRIAKAKLAATQQFGDLVEVSNFLLEMGG